MTRIMRQATVAELKRGDVFDNPTNGKTYGLDHTEFDDLGGLVLCVIEDPHGQQIPKKLAAEPQWTCLIWTEDSELPIERRERE